MNYRLFQVFMLFGFYVVMTAVDAPTGARAGYATATCITLIVFVVEQVSALRRKLRSRK